MADEKAKHDAEMVKSLKELFTEYVTLHRQVGDKKFFEFKVPWHAIFQIEGYSTDPENYADYKVNKKACSDVWWVNADGKQKSAFLDTPQEVEDKIAEAKNKTLAAIKKHRMLIIYGLLS
ncbi:MAG: hypothetical protein CL561_04055 [Alphaproteobacteria bacterium]|nr:hypothetical protein [Alphaproteobacteria bacterium]